MGSLNTGFESATRPPLPPRPALPPIMDNRVRAKLTPKQLPYPACSTNLRQMLQSGCADPSVTRCNLCLRSLQDLVRQAYELVVQDSPNCPVILSATPLSHSSLIKLSERLRMPEHPLIRAADGRCASCATAVAQLKADAFEHVRNSIFALPANKVFRGFQRIQAHVRSRPLVVPNGDVNRSPGPIGPPDVNTA
ncbi:unnamed protein product [Echinostoma caproni]|uniref:Saposin B-type domain-containing protein n=1 Tax=Echinostoma caproni TaxID=27848 RepID=A0A183A6Y8_9TREM|nr:unnamed protein product [Echinostoma caproni]